MVLSACCLQLRGDDTAEASRKDELAAAVRRLPSRPAQPFSHRCAKQLHVDARQALLDGSIVDSLMVQALSRLVGSKANGLLAEETVDQLLDTSLAIVLLNKALGKHQAISRGIRHDHTDTAGECSQLWDPEVECKKEASAQDREAERQRAGGGGARETC